MVESLNLFSNLIKIYYPIIEFDNIKFIILLINEKKNRIDLNWEMES